jgi:hypothetical protein
MTRVSKSTAADRRIKYERVRTFNVKQMALDFSWLG